MFVLNHLKEIMDTTVKDISKKVAKLDINEASTSLLEENPCILSATTKGDYCISILMHTNNQVLKTIAQNMKHGLEATEEEIPMYTLEFFNIVCGRVVSSFNRAQNVKATFDIPQFYKGGLPPLSEFSAKHKREFHYICSIGGIKFEAFCHCQEREFIM